jgi:hypothetical protein
MYGSTMNKKSYVSIALAATILVVMTAAATAAAAIVNSSPFANAKTPDGKNVCNDGHCSGMNAAIGWARANGHDKDNGNNNGNNDNDDNAEAATESNDD